MTDQDRIKLAETMGWRWSPNQAVFDGQLVGGGRWHRPDGSYTELSRKNANIPDPENDANDDYAVLEWARTELKQKHSEIIKAQDGSSTMRESTPFEDFKIILYDRHPFGDYDALDYQIGDYARAALKVLK